MKDFKLLVAATVILSAQQALCLSIVTVKAKQVAQESARGISIQEKMQTKEKELFTPLKKLEAQILDEKKKLTQKQKNLQQKAGSLEKQASLLSEDARIRKFEELQDEKREVEELAARIQRLQHNLEYRAKQAQQRLSPVYQKEMQSFDQEIKDTLKSVAIKEGWDLVLTEESVAYASPKMDKTDVVTAQLDEQHKKRIKSNIEKEKKVINKEEEKIAKLKKEVSSLKKRKLTDQGNSPSKKVKLK